MFIGTFHSLAAGILDREFREPFTIIAEEEKKKLKIEASVKNKGNVHIRPTGKAMIEDEAGKKVIELDLALGKPALPSEETGYDFLWDKPELKTGAYKISVTIDYGKELNMEKTATLEKTLEVDKDGKVTVK